MQDEVPRRRRRVNGKKIKRFFTLVICAYFLVTVARLVINQEVSKARQQQEFETLSQQLEEIAQSNEELERKIEFAQSNSYIERYARDQLGYVKEGEIKFVQGGTMGLPPLTNDQSQQEPPQDLQAEDAQDEESQE